MGNAAHAEAQQKARDYLNRRGTMAPAPVVCARIGEAFATLGTFLDEVPAELALRRADETEWSIQEIVDHLLETHRPGLDELRCLLAGERPPEPPIPASLRSRAPRLRPWPWLKRELAEVHAEILAALESVPPDFETPARAPLVMVVNVPDERGGSVPLEWIEDLDWKAYAIVFRLHAIDHLNQAKSVLEALR